MQNWIFFLKHSLLFKKNQLKLWYLYSNCKLIHLAKCLFFSKIYIMISYPMSHRLRLRISDITQYCTMMLQYPILHIIHYMMIYTPSVPNYPFPGRWKGRIVCTVWHIILLLLWHDTRCIYWRFLADLVTDPTIFYCNVIHICKQVEPYIYQQYTLGHAYLLAIEQTPGLFSCVTTRCDEPCYRYHNQSNRLPNFPVNIH